MINKNNKHEYKGFYLTKAQVYALPECEVSKNTARKRLLNGETVEQAIKKRKKEGVGRKAGYKKKSKALKVKKITEQQKLKNIFKNPVNPNKCRYHQNQISLLDEVSKGGFLSD